MRGKYYSLILMLMLFIFLPGCGGGADDLAPFDGTITINPESYTFTGTGADTETFSKLFTISVVDADGLPVSNIKLTISYLFAVPASFAVVQLYDGNTPKDSPMTVQTDDYGVYNLVVGFNAGGGLEYYADLEVRSGAVFEKATITVNDGS